MSDTWRSPIDLEGVEQTVRARLRALRQQAGWSLDDLAARSNLSASARGRDDVAAQPAHQHHAGDEGPPGPDRPAAAAARPPGTGLDLRLSGRVRLRLGQEDLLVETGEAAEFDTLTPHVFLADGGPAELIAIYDRAGHEAHLVAGDDPQDRTSGG